MKLNFEKNEYIMNHQIKVLPLIKSPRCFYFSYYASYAFMYVETVSLRVALSKKTPPYSKTFAGLSSRILNINNSNNPPISGCALKYLSLVILNSSYINILNI